MAQKRHIAGLLTAVLAAAAIGTPSRIVAAPAAALTAGPPACHTVVSPALVYAIRGTVYRVNPNGRNRCRLTTAVNAKEPQLAPGGKRLAFFSGVGSNGIAVHVVRVGSGASSGQMIYRGQEASGRLTWSPNGRRLAFVGGKDVWVWNGTAQRARMLVAGTRNEPARTFAWSPDSRRLAAAFSMPPATRLLILVVNAFTRARHALGVRFPVWISGKRPYLGSYPSQIIAWLPGGRLLLGTSGFGIGLSLTSIWTVSPRGGRPRLVLGAHSPPVLRFSLLNDSQALVSPDGTKLLLDPLNHFWIAPVSARNGHVLNLHIHGSCALAQAVWVGNTRLAYVTVCTIGGSANILQRLYTLPASGGRPRLLATARAPQQETLSIAPPTRCIACGAG